jgi:hypothetical protein
MRTSSNQLIHDLDYHTISPREEKYTLSPDRQEYYFQFYSLEGREADLKLRLLDISKFGARVQAGGSLDELASGMSFEAVIMGSGIQFPNRFSGVVVWKREEEGCCTWGVSFSHAIEINLITAIMDKAAAITASLKRPQGSRIHSNTLAFVHETGQVLQSLIDSIESLDELINYYGHEDETSQMHERVIEMVYRLVSPVLDRMNAEARDLFFSLPAEDIRLNFAHVREKLLPFLVLEPLFKRSIEKPLGYAGDHEMMQIIYRRRSEGANLLGKALHRWVLKTGSCRAVYGRRRFFYEVIKSRLEAATGPMNVLSIACGPASEIVDLLHNCPQRLLNRLSVHLLDQDPRAVTEARHNIRVAQLKTGRHLDVHFLNLELGRFLVQHRQHIDTPFDLIYSAGLFDYVRQGVARKITRRLFHMTKPGGEIFLGNFSIDSADIGFMEIIDWSLIYRTQEEILDFGALIEQPREEKVVESDHCQKFYYLKKV